jgi:hypothetical protein
MTNNNILIGHLGWDGCHFLASCLAMSDEVYFNHFTLRGKIEYYFKNMSNITKVDGNPVWSDVFMFYGSSYQSNGYVHYRQALINDFNNSFERFSPEEKLGEKVHISRLHVPIYYPLSDMMERNLSHPIVDMFRSKYFICLVNTRLFASLRSIKIKEDTRISNSWDDGFAIIPDIKWYDGPLTNMDEITNSTTVSGFNELTTEVRGNLESYHKSGLDDLFQLTELYKIDNDLLKTLITHQWDCNWFLNEDATIENLKVLYCEMNLGQLNEKLIRKMYQLWINKMDYIKKWYMGYESDDISFQTIIPSADFFPSDRWINHI